MDGQMDGRYQVHYHWQYLFSNTPDGEKDWQNLSALIEHDQNRGAQEASGIISHYVNCLFLYVRGTIYAFIALTFPF